MTPLAAAVAHNHPELALLARAALLTLIILGLEQLGKRRARRNRLVVKPDTKTLGGSSQAFLDQRWKRNLNQKLAELETRND